MQPPNSVIQTGTPHLNTLLGLYHQPEHQVSLDTFHTMNQWTSRYIPSVDSELRMDEWKAKERNWLGIPSIRIEFGPLGSSSPEGLAHGCCLAEGNAQSWCSRSRRCCRFGIAWSSAASGQPAEGCAGKLLTGSAMLTFWGHQKWGPWFRPGHRSVPLLTAFRRGCVVQLIMHEIFWHGGCSPWATMFCVPFASCRSTPRTAWLGACHWNSRLPTVGGIAIMDGDIDRLFGIAPTALRLLVPERETSSSETHDSPI